MCSRGHVTYTLTEEMYEQVAIEARRSGRSANAVIRAEIQTSLNPPDTGWRDGLQAFLDTPVLLYALGAESAERAPCRRLIQASVDRGVRLHTDVGVLQEVLYHRLRRTTGERALAECRQLADNPVVHDVTLEVWRRATELVETTSIRGRDSFHAAAAFLAGFDAIVTTDSDFDGILGLRRIDPRGV